MEFEVCEAGETSYWRAQNLRQSDIEKGNTVKKTVRQWIYDVTGFKDQQEKISGSTMSLQQIAKKYKTNMKYARNTEMVSESFVDSAVTIDRRILSHPDCRESLEFLDNYCLSSDLAHPFASIYSLQAVCDRCPEKKYPGSKQIALVLAHLVDNYLNGNINMSHFALRTLRDPVRATLRSFTYALQCMHGSLTPT